VLLKKNDEPVTGIIYDALSNGQLKYETSMKNGIRLGKSRIWYENGISSVAIFSLNKKKRRWLYSEQIDSFNGAWKIKYYHKNGNLLSKEKTIDLVAGGPFKYLFKEWYDNGKIKSREARQVKKNKIVPTYWYENGQIKKKQNGRITPAKMNAGTRRVIKSNVIRSTLTNKPFRFGFLSSL
jgi:antitoxin component YwqK of YwqJK toxin-antitoxin module